MEIKKGEVWRILLSRKGERSGEYIDALCVGDNIGEVIYASNANRITDDIRIGKSLNIEIITDNTKTKITDSYTKYKEEFPLNIPVKIEEKIVTRTKEVIKVEKVRYLPKETIADKIYNWYCKNFQKAKITNQTLAEEVVIRIYNEDPIKPEKYVKDIAQAAEEALKKYK